MSIILYLNEFLTIYFQISMLFTSLLGFSWIYLIAFNVTLVAKWRCNVIDYYMLVVEFNISSKFDKYHAIIASFALFKFF